MKETKKGTHSFFKGIHDRTHPRRHHGDARLAAHAPVGSSADATAPGSSTGGGARRVATQAARLAAETRAAGADAVVQRAVVVHVSVGKCSDGLVA